MNYPNIHKATFLERPNRFVALVRLGESVERVHVKNTGRCRELLTTGAAVWLTRSDKPGRKTAFDLIAVEKGPLLVNMDAQAPNQVFREFAESGAFLPDLTQIRPEFTHGDSRFDFCLEQGERRHLVEVKGVTLEENGAARFPDAPTERGVKHLRGLMAARQAGYDCTVCFVVQFSPVRWVEPNDSTHPAFGAALREAAQAGVNVLALSCAVTPDSLRVNGKVPVRLNGSIQR